MITSNRIEPGLSEWPERRGRRLLGAMLLIGLGAAGVYAAGAHSASSPEIGVQQSEAIPVEPASDEDLNNDGD